MIDPVMGAAGVDPNWTAEEWTAVLKQALDERDRFKERLQHYMDSGAELMEECRRLRDEPNRLRVEIGELEAGQERCEEALHDARELAAMYLQCLNSRALERGETVEQVAAFCEQEFAENPWLKEEYEKLSAQEARVKAFCREWKLR